MEKLNIIGMKTLKIQDGVTILKRIKVKTLAKIPLTRMAKNINILVLRINLKRTQSFDLLLLYLL